MFICPQDVCTFNIAIVRDETILCEACLVVLFFHRALIEYSVEGIHPRQRRRVSHSPNFNFYKYHLQFYLYCCFSQLLSEKDTFRPSIFIFMAGTDQSTHSGRGEDNLRKKLAEGGIVDNFVVYEKI